MFLQINSALWVLMNNILLTWGKYYIKWAVITLPYQVWPSDYHPVADNWIDEDGSYMFKAKTRRFIIHIIEFVFLSPHTKTNCRS